MKMIDFLKIEMTLYKYLLEIFSFGISDFFLFMCVWEVKVLMSNNW